MENNEAIVKQKSNKGVIILLVIIIIILLGISGYLAYDKFIAKDTKPETNETTDTTTKEETKNDMISNNIDDQYKQFINNIKVRKNAEIVSARPSGDYKHFILGTDNKLYVETYNDNDTKIPGAVGSGGDYTGKYINIDGVVRIFYTHHTPGEGGSHDGMLLLKEDGSLYIMREPETENYKLEKLEYKNIVTAYDTISGQGTTYVVDIQGNSFEIK